MNKKCQFNLTIDLNVEVFININEQTGKITIERIQAIHPERFGKQVINITDFVHPEAKQLIIDSVKKELFIANENTKCVFIE
jgi:hypothetical protein